MVGVVHIPPSLRLHDGTCVERYNHEVPVSSGRGSQPRAKLVYALPRPLLRSRLLPNLTHFHPHVGIA